ncbi:MAG TPA: hypothetical protein VLR72_02595 [Clostridiaceae bacterium]|nr:hypothetical protein [Clostridiaceae bacterium]
MKKNGIRVMAAVLLAGLLAAAGYSYQNQMSAKNAASKETESKAEAKEYCTAEDFGIETVKSGSPEILSRTEIPILP